MSDVASAVDVEGEVNKLRYRLARASALVLATETSIEQTTWGDDADENRRRMEGLAHLVGAAGEALKAAIDAADMIAAQLAKRTATNPSYEA